MSRVRNFRLVNRVRGASKEAAWVGRNDMIKMRAKSQTMRRRSHGLAEYLTLGM